MNIYESPHYKKLLIAPAILLAATILSVSLTGLHLGIDLKGGISITAPVKPDLETASLEKELASRFGMEDVSVKKTASPTGTGLLIEYTGNRDILRAEGAMQAKNYDEAISILGAFTGDLNVTGEPADRAAVYYSKAREKFKNDLATFLSERTGTPQDQFSIREIGAALGSRFWGDGIREIGRAHV
jgi:preprotein translocase subunit SecF